MSQFSIQIQAMGILKDYLGSGPFDLQVPQGAGVEYLLKWVRQNPLVHPDLTIAVVNDNQFCSLDVLLKEQQLYYIIPPVSGG
ncbi:MAG: hypothetical protein RL609_518 [Bacteroidota bacterium]|jgi:molybdopterin converting factor small subunit